MGLATSLWDLYQQFQDAKRTELLRAVFETVAIGPEGVVGFTLKPPFDRFAKARTEEQTNSGTELAKAVLDAP